MSSIISHQQDLYFSKGPLSVPKLLCSPKLRERFVNNITQLVNQIISKHCFANLFQWKQKFDQIFNSFFIDAVEIHESLIDTLCPTEIKGLSDSEAVSQQINQQLFSQTIFNQGQNVAINQQNGPDPSKVALHEQKSMKKNEEVYSQINGSKCHSDLANQPFELAFQDQYRFGNAVFEVINATIANYFQPQTTPIKRSQVAQIVHLIKYLLSQAQNYCILLAMSQLGSPRKHPNSSQPSHTIANNGSQNLK